MLAGRQYGVVSRAQLLAIGVTARMIDTRVAAGRLHVIHRGVYAVGHTRIPREGRWLAAVLACGDRAVLSHRSAAALWGIRPYTGKPEVTARNAHRRGGVFMVSRSSISPDECTEHGGIPCTTPERTLIDLANVLQPHQLDRAIREAEFLRLVDFAKVERLAANRRRMRGLRIALDRLGDSTPHTRSDLEDRFRTLLLDEDLPTPELNGTIELSEMTIEADAVWRDHKVIVELDSWQWHGTRSQFAIDRARDRVLAHEGWLVLRYTWHDLTPREAQRLRDLLSARKPPRSGHPRSAAPPA